MVMRNHRLWELKSKSDLVVSGLCSNFNSALLGLLSKRERERENVLCFLASANIPLSLKSDQNH